LISAAERAVQYIRASLTNPTIPLLAVVLEPVASAPIQITFDPWYPIKLELPVAVDFLNSPSIYILTVYPSLS
jgi:hypothetical protein